MITSIGHRSLAIARARMIAAGLIEADGEETCAAVNLLARSGEPGDAGRAERLLRRAILDGGRPVIGFIGPLFGAAMRVMDRDVVLDDGKDARK
ncbi:hypothetical protein [Oceanicella actignis]|uniref:hypothetical protein n=1 Tax=Oceanicella actignis TaxID=1189325 RepID=UPI0011E88ED3|nr:hypothetical protein [Oceanicella actignis]TYO91460.1 hypothetical protein LY05_00313 [Oceanicella actignis]